VQAERRRGSPGALLWLFIHHWLGLQPSLRVERAYRLDQRKFEVDREEAGQPGGMKFKLALACAALAYLASAANGCAVQAHWQCDNFPHAFGATRAIGNDFLCHDKHRWSSSNVGVFMIPYELPISLAVDLLILPYALLHEPEPSEGEEGR